MDVILTHEQADFDALASLLGAHLLNETAVPVLPRRLNRNVRAYLTLYGLDLPFVDPRDLKTEIVNSVTLVDTQSLISVKGATKQTRIHVIDHHAPRPDLPKEWVVTTDETGANTTMFVEALVERDGPLSMVEATLLLLGIYEDTGSLTYTRTTPRDVRAAGYLLERGASLQIATSFLNHPLSIGQQKLYDQLRAEIQKHSIHGFTVLIAKGDAREMDEELSTIAHKLRDLLDPDALFLLLATGGGIQLIARSTCEQIDVSLIANHFGGGGHERAAAALIRSDDIDATYAEIVNLLPKHIHPAITVAQIMSRGPQLLSPDTPVGEAAQRMQRFGYEGYPVVEDGRVVGLLTRRAVDRAQSHRLNLTAASLMDAGQVSVEPQDSIDHLQRVMTDTGWGQIPVINPEDGEIIGIVTRTDLLNTLAPQTGLLGGNNLAERLESILPPARLLLLRIVAQVAYDQRAALFIVGGFVRDLLLEHPSLDFDLVVEGDAIALAKALSKKFGGRVTSHSRFGTAKWYIHKIRTKILAHLDENEINKVLPQVSDADAKAQLSESDLPDSIDFVSARTEFYTHPTALPTVERGSIKLDLHRRDFTINTLALRLDGRHYGELSDYWGGLEDLENGIVRVLHSLSFVDDPTRILRAVRFEQRFKFQIEERTMELLLEAKSMLRRVSGERLRHEIENIMAEDRYTDMIARLNELDMLSAIHADLKWDTWLAEKFEKIPSDSPDSAWNVSDRIGKYTLKEALAYTIWLIRLGPDRAARVVSRLNIANNLGESITAACRCRERLESLSGGKPSDIVSVLETMPALAIYANYLTTDNNKAQKSLKRYSHEWQHVLPRISGHDLQELGLPPGPAYKQIIASLRDAWLDGEIKTTKAEKKLLEKLIRDYKSEKNGDD